MRADILNAQGVSLSNDTIAIRDKSDEKGDVAAITMMVRYTEQTLFNTLFLCPPYQSSSSLTP